MVFGSLLQEIEEKFKFYLWNLILPHRVFLDYITGISALTALSLFATRRFNWAVFFFVVLAVGFAGVAWNRYSTKSGSPLDLITLKKGRRLDENELGFIVSHVPYAFLARLSFLLSGRLQKK